jgi:cis-2,3-dihydrobiphenyl-2,3-diol dehydrogenase
VTLLKDKVVLVTGGGSGLGAGVARHFLTQGAQLAIMDISGEKLDALRTEFGDGVLLVQGDVSRRWAGASMRAHHARRR